MSVPRIAFARLAIFAFILVLIAAQARCEARPFALQVWPSQMSARVHAPLLVHVVLHNVASRNASIWEWLEPVPFGHDKHRLKSLKMQCYSLTTGQAVPYRVPYPTPPGKTVAEAQNREMPILIRAHRLIAVNVNITRFCALGPGDYLMTMQYDTTEIHKWIRVDPRAWHGVTNRAYVRIHISHAVQAAQPKRLSNYDDLEDYVDPEVDDLSLSNHMTVYIDRLADEHPIRVDWTDASGFRSQLLDLPPLSRNAIEPDLPKVWWPSDEYPNDYTPRVMRWPGRAVPTIIVVAGEPSGVYDMCAPLIFELRDHRWHVISTRPDEIVFTNRGTFFVRGSRLYVSDFVCDWSYAHTAPQKYWLKEFTLHGSHLSFVSDRTTKHRYPWANGQTIPRSQDPLREFGLRWRWWGQSTR